MSDTFNRRDLENLIRKAKRAQESRDANPAAKPAETEDVDRD